MSTHTVSLHCRAELLLVAVDDTTGIVQFQACSASMDTKVNTVALNTATGSIHCDCQGAACNHRCWHADHVIAAWLYSPAMCNVYWLTDTKLIAYGKKSASMVAIYRERIGCVLPSDALNLVATRYEWRRRQLRRSSRELILAAVVVWLAA